MPTRSIVGIAARSGVIGTALLLVPLTVRAGKVVGNPVCAEDAGGYQCCPEYGSICNDGQHDVQDAYWVRLIGPCEAP